MDRLYQPKRQKRRWPIVVVFLFILTAAYSYYSLTRTITIPGLTKSVNQLSAKTSNDQITWPASGNSAISIVDSNIKLTHGDQSPAATASVAKTITALTVLDKYPLKMGETGPQVTLTEADVALYNSYLAKDGSLVKVSAGEKISLFQMLQAIMLPSSNNMADTTAIWAFGSLSNYTKAANAFLLKNGIKNTTVGSDASGFDPSTISTPSDLLKIGELAMKNPVLSEIVAQKEVTNFPVAGTIKNTNRLLGKQGIVGIKTGNSDQAGYVLLNASKININKASATILTIYMDAPNPIALFDNTETLTKSLQNNFHAVAFAKANKKVGSYNLPWGGSVDVVADRNYSIRVWNGADTQATLKLNKIDSSSKANTPVGTIGVEKSATNKLPLATVRLEKPPTQPSVFWRLTHPL